MATPASPARIAAARVLLRLEQDAHAFSAESLDEAITTNQLDPRDARLATSIVYGTLRNAFLLDYQYRGFLRQAPSRLDSRVQVLLRIAAFQHLMLQRIPAHAIASDSVEIARRTFRLHSRELAFVNALVRRIVTLKELKQPGDDDANSLSLKCSLPQWLVDYLVAKFGQQDGQQIMLSGLAEPPVCIRVNRLRTSLESMEQLVQDMGGHSTRGELSTDALCVTDLPLQSLVQHERFLAGDFYLQDEGSQLVAHLVSPRPGESILDLCAAPGGKTTHLAELSCGRAQIVATDISDSRLQLLQANLSRLQTPGVEIAEIPNLGSRTFDAVLVDAPCSGLGTLRRNPEIRYRITMDQVQKMAAGQSDILYRAAQFVSPGGRLVYSTCTVTDEENRNVIQQFLTNNADFCIAPPFPGLPPTLAALRGADGFFRTWPVYPRIDGFEAVVLQRTTT